MTVWNDCQGMGEEATKTIHFCYSFPPGV